MSAGKAAGSIRSLTVRSGAIAETTHRAGALAIGLLHFFEDFFRSNRQLSLGQVGHLTFQRRSPSGGRVKHRLHIVREHRALFGSQLRPIWRLDLRQPGPRLACGVSLDEWAQARCGKRRWIYKPVTDAMSGNKCGYRGFALVCINR